MYAGFLCCFLLCSTHAGQSRPPCNSSISQIHTHTCTHTLASDPLTLMRELFASGSGLLKRMQQCARCDGTNARTTRHTTYGIRHGIRAYDNNDGRAHISYGESTRNVRASMCRRVAAYRMHQNFQSQRRLHIMLAAVLFVIRTWTVVEVITTGSRLHHLFSDYS